MVGVGRCSFPRAFKSDVKFHFLLGEFDKEFERYVKEGSGNGQLSP